MKAHVGIPNPAYVTHPSAVAPRRVHVDGISPSDCGLVMAMIQFHDGKVGVVVDNVEPNFENLVKTHELLTKVLEEMDRRIQLYAQTIPGEQ